MFPLLLITMGVTQPPYPVVEKEIIEHVWEEIGDEYIQELQFGYGEDFDSFPPVSAIYYAFEGRHKQKVYVFEDGFYCRRILYYKQPFDGYNYLNLGCFYQNSTIQPEPIKEDISEQDTLQPPISEKKEVEYILPKTIDYRDNSSNDTPQVLGTKEKKCEMSILESKVINSTCDLGISITNIIHIKVDNLYILQIEGKYKESIQAIVKLYECEKFNIYKPTTWFKCNHSFKKQLQKELKLTYTAKVYPALTDTTPNFSFNESNFYLKYIFSKDISSLNPFALVHMYSQFKDDVWVDIEYIKKFDIKVPTSQIEDVSKRIFNFPIDRKIGVTQWHGCTKYQCPHKGIDFGARLNKVLAVGDGTVIETGWDSYGGNCNQGGNYVIIKHANGIHSTYFHLASYVVKKGDVVSKKQVIAISGNTGKWNCQNLGYHLHFGLRTSKSSNYDINPVPYIAVDWNLIPTIGKESYPNRLSGDNPHPNF